tara:strand:+ start:842 stop:1534 length:693 start_codon:yes stop_codon:yes gene_type:complete
MSGITRIQQGREESRRPDVTFTPGKEIWFRDGDQVFLSSVATGSDDDKYLDELYLYVFRAGTRLVNLLKDDRVDTSIVPEDVRPSHKFAIWAYIHNIIHLEKRNDDWVEIEGPSGKKMYKEDINDFRIISLSFGRSDYIWNQLVDVYNDWGALNKGVIRMKRTGAGMYETSYSITATPKNDEIPEDKQKEISELPLLKDYFYERYGNSADAAMDIAKNAASSNDTEEALF